MVKMSTFWAFLLLPVLEISLCEGVLSNGEIYDQPVEIGGRYEGVFNKGKMNGRGVYYYDNGDIYEGEFKENKRDGEGVYFYKSGDKYVGRFRDGKLNGKGVYQYKNGVKLAEEFVDNQPRRPRILTRLIGKLG